MLDRLRLLLILAAVAPLAVATMGGAGATGAAAPVSVYPVAGTPVASAHTQVSFRGASAAELGVVTVRGSRSGAHSGRLAGHSDGHGASFLPDKPFMPGEQVAVTAGVPLAGASGGAVRFGVAVTPPAHRIDYTFDPGGRPRESLRFHSAPSIYPASMRVTRSLPGHSPDDVFLGLKAARGANGPAIYDDRGQLVWFKRISDKQSATDVRVQQYQGRPVLTWWQGRVFLPGEGLGEGVIADTSYRRVATVRAGNGYRADVHEFQLTPQGTALVLSYRPTVWNLRSVHGPARGIAIDTVVQEIDVKTGLVEFEWHALGNVGMREAYGKPFPGQPFDFIHTNSIDQEPNGNLLLSARNANSLLEVDRASGRILWRLGGKRSDFKLGPGTQFVAQHDVRRAPNGHITLFDNGQPPASRRKSRAEEIAVDTATMTAKVAQADVHSPATTRRARGACRRCRTETASWAGAAPCGTYRSSAPRGTCCGT